MELPSRFRRTAPRPKLPALVALGLLLGGALLLPSPGGALASGSTAAATPLTPSRNAPIVLPALLALQQAELTGLSGTQNDAFGCSVAVSGDTALVGASAKTVGTLGQTGAVYVFVRSGTTWTQQAELTASDAAAGDLFGCSIALSGDTALVGASAKSVGTKPSAGAAYVFVRSGTTWTEQAELTATDAAAKDRFGSAVALDGDTALIGAPAKGRLFIGAAYVFVRSGTTWTQDAELTPYDNPPGDGVAFGSSLALSDDTALIAAPALETATNQNMGGAYVFVGSGATWSRQALLRNPRPATDGGFASAVALDGDKALIGVEGGAVGTYSDAGIAYVLVRSGTRWSWQARLSDPHPTQYDSYGCAVALSGNRALIGAKFQSFGRQYFAGAAYLYVHSEGRWSQQPVVRDLDQSAGGGFGLSVAFSGNTTLAGANGKSVAGKRTGSIAYVDTLVPAPRLGLWAAPAGLKVGRVLTVSGIVTNALDPVRTVQIWRRFPGKTRLYGTVNLPTPVFTWRMKPKVPATMVLVATYKAGGTTFKGEAVTVKVRR